MDTPVLPEHLVALREAWRREAERLQLGVVPPLAHSFEHPPLEGYGEFLAWNREQTEALQRWVTRTTNWLSGPLAYALEHPPGAAAMGRTASQLGRCIDELHEQRALLRTADRDPTLRSTAPWVDAAWFALLEQLRDFVTSVVQALEPETLAKTSASTAEGKIELDFCFRPDIAVPMANYAAWLRNASGRISRSAGETSPLPPARPASLYGALLVAIVLLALIFWAGALAWIWIIGIALILFIVRHPLLALLAFIIGIS